MKAKRIVQVSAYYPPHLGGQENAVYDLARQLAGTGREVCVLTSTAGGGPKGTRLEEGVQVSRLSGRIFGHAPIMPGFPAALLRTAPADSVVHVHIGQAFTPEMVWLISKLQHFKYIAELHIDFEPSGPGGVLLPLYKRLILKRVLQSADAVITLNEKTLQTVRELYGYTGRAEVVSNGIDEDYFAVERPLFAQQPPRELHLLFVGRLSKQKNIRVLLEALRHTKRSVHLDIVGDGEDRGLIEDIVAKHGLRNVTLHGRLPRQQVMDFYKACDALVMPSLYEAQPLVLLEAMATRIPIIGTNVIGVAEHLRGAGIVVDPSPQGIAEGIEQYYARYSLLPDMVAQGYAVAENLRWPHTLKKYEALYEEIARG